MTNNERSSQSWRDSDRNHHLHPFTNLRTYASKGGRVVTNAEHIYITDSDGNRMLDGMSGLWCCSLGYSQGSIKAAITQQLETLPYYNSFFNCSNDAAIAMAEKLVEVLPDHLNHIFFTNSGSEANDTNIRLIHRYFDALGKPAKKHIISRKNGYHGSTIAAGSLSGMSYMHAQYWGISYVHHVAQPYGYGDFADVSAEDCGRLAAQSLADKIDELGADNVAAFIAEPIQGAGGVIIPPANYWSLVERICRERDVLIVSDEVICGFGRTGQWFGCQTFGFEPDLLTFAKAVTNGYQPLGGVAVSDKVVDVLMSENVEFNHGFTYSGHPVPCAAGLATLAAYESLDVITANRILAAHFNRRWLELGEHPIVGEARTTGLLGALELVANKSTRAHLAADSAGTVFCRDSAIKRGLMVRAVKDAIVSAPPFVCSIEEIDLLIDRLHEALNDTARHYGMNA
jgi:putrescine---pyruvate transaminase